MPNLYKNSKIDENALTPCSKCSCLILSDSSDPDNETCIQIKKTPNNQDLRSSSEYGDDDNGDINVKQKNKPTVKIYLKGPPTDEESIDKSTSASEKNARVEAPEKDSKKHICFRFCRKKKPADKQKPDLKSGGNQTSKPALNTTKTQISRVDIVNDVVKAATKPCTGSAGGGCNTNTIIFQKDPAGGDGIASLEHWLKREAKSNNRNLEDILTELHKQRKEIRELKDMLDTVVRALRDQLFMTAFGKTKNDLFTDFAKKNELRFRGDDDYVTKNTPCAKVFELIKDLLLWMSKCPAYTCSKISKLF